DVAIALHRVEPLHHAADQRAAGRRRAAGDPLDRRWRAGKTVATPEPIAATAEAIAAAEAVTTAAEAIAATEAVTAATETVTATEAGAAILPRPGRTPRGGMHHA